MVISMMPEQLDEEDTLHADEDPLQGPAVGMGVKSLEFQWDSRDVVLQAFWQY